MTFRVHPHSPFTRRSPHISQIGPPFRLARYHVGFCPGFTATSTPRLHRARTFAAAVGYEHLKRRANCPTVRAFFANSRTSSSGKSIGGCGIGPGWAAKS